MTKFHLETYREPAEHKPELCSRCPTGEENPAEPPHLCPFGVEIDNDLETLCDCCEDCENNCAMDI